MNRLKELKKELRKTDDFETRSRIWLNIDIEQEKISERREKRLDRLVKIAAIATPLITLAITTYVSTNTTNKILKFEETGSVTSFAGKTLLGRNLK